jgi:hypothetical protein
MAGEISCPTISQIVTLPFWISTSFYAIQFAIDANGVVPTEFLARTPTKTAIKALILPVAVMLLQVLSVISTRCLCGTGDPLSKRASIYTTAMAKGLRNMFEQTFMFVV